MSGIGELKEKKLCAGPAASLDIDDGSGRCGAVFPGGLRFGLLVIVCCLTTTTTTPQEIRACFWIRLFNALSVFHPSATDGRRRDDVSVILRHAANQKQFHVAPFSQGDTKKIFTDIRF
jgi:hypothetical protein